jgi:hypothetical protein
LELADFFVALANDVFAMADGGEVIAEAFADLGEGAALESARAAPWARSSLIWWWEKSIWFWSWLRTPSRRSIS